MTDRNFTKSMCKPLPKEVRSLVRSGITITNVAQCVEELVLNSVDANSTTIYVGVNLDNFSVRVEDNGIGLSKHDLEVVGTRYTTSKCQCLNDLSVLRHYGYRGEALASIITVSAAVDLIGRTEDAAAPYKKRFVKGNPKGNVEKQPDSKKKTRGLNVFVCNLLSELPVRQKRVEKSIQLEEIKSVLQHIVLINPSLCIEFRNESNGTRILEHSGCASFADAFRQLYGSRNGLNHINLIEEHHLYDGLFFTACIGKESHRLKNFQLIYVNKRFIGRGKIHRYLNQSISKVLGNGNQKKDGQKEKTDDNENGSPVVKEKYPIFIVNIKCPLNLYDITLEPKKMQVEFRDWDVLVKGLDGLVLCFQSTLQSTDKCKIVKRNSRFAAENEITRADNERRKSRPNLDEEDEEYGLGVTTHDVKRAIHSRFTVRENLVEDCSDITSNKSLNMQKSIQTASSGLERVTLDSSKKERKPKMSQSLKPRQTTTYRLKPMPTRTTTYDIRLLNGKRKARENIHPPGLIKNRIYVSKKPRINAAIFQKFSQWANKVTPAASNSSQALSVSDSPVKRPRKSSLEEQFGYKKKLGYSQARDQILINKKQPNDVTRFEEDDDMNGDMNNGMTKSEEDSWKWKINRYINECRLEKKTLEKEKETGTGNKLIMKPKMKYLDTCTSTDPSESKTLHSILQSEHTIAEKQRLDDATSAEKDKFNSCSDILLKVPANWVWAIDHLNHAMEEFAEKHLKCKNRSEEIKKQIRQELESSEIGLEFLRQVEGTETKSKTTNEVKSFLKPATLGLGNVFSKEIKTDARHQLKSSGIGKDFLRQMEGTDTESKTENTNELKSFLPAIFGNIFPKEVRQDLKSSEIGMASLRQVEGTDKETKTEISENANEVNSFLPAIFGNVFKKSVPTLADLIVSDWDGSLEPTEITVPNCNIKVEEVKGWNKLKGNSQSAMEMSGEKHLKCNSEEIKKKIRQELESSEIGLDFLRQFEGTDKKTRTTTEKTNEVKSFLKPTICGNVFAKSVPALADLVLSERRDRSVEPTEIPVSNLNAPEVKCWNKLKGNAQSSFRFSKQDLSRVKVLTQLDRKFIIAKVSTLSASTEKITDVLVIFDQHAVHERIRLEKLIEESYVEGPSGQKEIKRFAIVPSMPLTFSETEVRIMQSYKEGFDTIGVKIEPLSSTSVKIASAPKCFAEKVATENIANREPVMRKLLSALMQEQVCHIIDTKGSLQSMPKIIFNILCSQACHGAIKFGDQLELSVCQKLLTELKDCKTPFQCAHGRPALVPLLDLESLKYKTDVELSMCHYDYTAENFGDTVEMSSQGKRQKFEEESSYFESSSGYFSSEVMNSNPASFSPMDPVFDFEFSLFNP